MAIKPQKTIPAIILIVIAVAAATVFYFYNKGPLNIENTKGTLVTAAELYRSYINDPLTAQKKYNDQVLIVRGEVLEVSFNSNNQKIIMMKTGSPAAFINCTLEEPANTIKTAGEINIKGICGGIGQGFPEMGIKGDVYLSRCLIVK